MTHRHKRATMLAVLTMLTLVGLLAITVTACLGRESGKTGREGANLEEGAQEGVVYENLEYGFKFSLPDGWKGYSVELDEWIGTNVDGSEGQDPCPNGPIITIRHPEWTEDKPRQDIPIMVFTHAQWEAMEQGAFHIGAAPIGPRELDRNGKYVFALPARYNFAFPEGYEEVEAILETNPLQANENYS